MIRDIIQTTALTSDIADIGFRGRIEGQPYRQDQSLTAVARALFGHRLEDCESITIVFDQRYGGTDFDTSFLKDLALPTGRLHVVAVSSGTDNLKKWMQPAREALKDSGLFEIEGLEAWFAASSKTNALIYTDQPYDPKIPKSPTDNTRTLIIMENMNVQRWHQIAAILPRLFNHWFTKCPLTDRDRQLSNSLTESTPDQFLSLIEEYAAEYDFRSQMIRNLLSDFETKHAKNVVRDLETRAKDLDAEINDYMRSIGGLLSQKEDILARLWGYQMQVEEALEPMVMNYFLANKNLYLKGANDTSLNFYTTAWLTNWDPEKAFALFDRGHCESWYRYSDANDIGRSDALLLFQAIFLEETVKVKFWSHVQLALSGENPLQFLKDDCISEIKNALPNPHHHEYACPGTNATYVAQRILEHNVVGAIEQCISATAGLDLTDTSPCNAFCRYLFEDHYGNCLYVKEKDQFMTTDEVISYLKTKKEAAHE